MNSVGQPVEQLGVAGPLALRAEVLDRLDQAGAEEHLPEPVDRHARRQRVRRVDEPVREPQPIVRRSPSGSGGEELPARPASPSRPACRTRRGSGRTSSRGVGMLLHDHHGGQARRQDSSRAARAAIRRFQSLARCGRARVLEEVGAELVGARPRLRPVGARMAISSIGRRAASTRHVVGVKLALVDPDVVDAPVEPAVGAAAAADPQRLAVAANVWLSGRRAAPASVHGWPST